VIFDLIKESKKVKKLKEPIFGFKKLSLVNKEVVILTDGDFHPSKLKDFFDSFERVVTVINSNNIQREKSIVGLLKKKNYVIVDHDSKIKISAKRMKEYLSYGFHKDADFYVSDLTSNEKRNFKINYDGSSIPVWSEKNTNKEGVLEITAALGVGVLLGLNFLDLTKRVKK